MPWPDLTLVPEGSVTRLIWFRRRPGNSDRGLRYLSSGSANVSSRQIRAELETFVETVVDRLRESGIPATPLQREWQAIRETDDDEAAFAAAVARLGLDPYSIDESKAALVVDLADTFDPALVEEILDAADPSVHGLRAASYWVRRAAEKVTERGRLLTETTNVALTDARIAGPYPWEAGYAAARALRESLSWSPTAPAQVENLIEIELLDGQPGGIEGFASRAVSPILILPEEPLSSARQRFQAAHALGLTMLTPLRESFVLDPSHTPLHQAARAFAAEFLAPAHGLEEMLAALGGRSSEQAFEAIAQQLRTSVAVVQRQYENQVLKYPAAI